jgi:hypothetical protein
METNWYVSAVASQTQIADQRPLAAMLEVSGEGTWVAEGLPAGVYTLAANVIERAAKGAPPRSPQKIHL